MANKIIQRRPLPKDTDLPNTLHPVLKRVLAARHIYSTDAIDYRLQNLHPHASLLGIEHAVTLLYDALVTQARILIVADFDADGATSCAVAVKALRYMGAQHVHYLVPNREKHGYGLTPDIVNLAIAYKPDLLITVDNGISSFQGVQAAKQQGMRVLITDHHLPPPQLPAADVIINPNQPGDTFPSKNMAGVGVIFYVMIALRAYLRDKGWFAKHQLSPPNLAQLLDLVALGTVVDVVKLDYNNRILVDQGLRRIRSDYCCPGIRALLHVSCREQSQLTANDLAFSLGPRLNAAGRMDDMSYGIACLLSEDDTTALRYAQLLDGFNQDRRFVEAEMQQEALDMIDTLGDPLSLPIGLCLFEQNWHQGVIGILASRIKDRLHRPVIVFTADRNHHIRGSARSVAGVHIRDVLSNIATQYPDMLSKFGGHAMAAGLSLPREHLEAFQQIFDGEVRKYLTIADLQGVILSDGILTAQDFTLDLAEQLRTITPFGQGFPEPLFDQEFEVLERRVLKDKHLKMQVRPVEGGEIMEVIAFNRLDAEWPSKMTCIQLAYKLDINLFRGFRNLQLVAEYIKPIS